jgi:hypothetical protein
MASEKSGARADVAPDQLNSGHSDWRDPKELADIIAYDAGILNHFANALGMSRTRRWKALRTSNAAIPTCGRTSLRS